MLVATACGQFCRLTSSPGVHCQRAQLEHTTYLILRKFAPYMICGQVALANIWLGTDFTPGDEPTRYKEIRKALEAPPWVVDTYDDF